MFSGKMDGQANDGSHTEEQIIANSSSFSSSSSSQQEMGFRPYAQQQLHQRARHRVGHPPRLIVNRPIVVKLTKDIVETYQLCNPSYKFSEAFNPTRYLTTPSVPVSNGGLDNEKSDLILSVNGVLINHKANHRYIIKDLLGQGTFGQVAKCWLEERDGFVAVKIIKNQAAYHQQAIVEISILDMLNGKFDPEDNHQIVRMIEHFYYQEHLCIVFEMLGLNLYELLKANNFKGFSLNLIRTFSKQILRALALLRDAGIIHCDLKPENILLTTSPGSAEIKLIDFGSACREDRTVYSYIQSRFYRSPEVVLGHAYTTAIDMWSFGCVAAELFLGLPLFPAQSQYDLLQRCIKVLGGKPPDYILRHAKSTSKYFKIARAPVEECGLSGERQYSSYHFLTPEEVRMRENESPVIGRHYFSEDWDLETLITSYHMRRGLSVEEIERESSKRLVFVDFLKGLVNMDPLKRWTPSQAEQHPFLTEVAFTGPFQPPPEVPRLPIRQVMNLDHNPGTGHWFGAGLSPQVSSNLAFQYGSPQQPGLSLSYGSSYIGSYGSFVGDVSSLGSNSDAVDVYMNHRTPPNASLGMSPDVRRKGHKPPYSFGYTHIGMSPSRGSLMPASLGASPSNLASPSSHFQPSPGSPSVGQTSRFGPTSPARTGGGGSASSLGKAAAIGQYNKRRGFGSPGSHVNASSESRSLVPEGSFNPPHPLNERSVFSQPESLPQSSLLDSPRSPSYASPFKQRNGLVAGTSTPQGQTSSIANFPVGSLGEYMQKKQAPASGEEETPPLPNPDDWDPSFSSEEFLFEGDTNPSEVAAVASALEGAGFGNRAELASQNTADFGRTGPESVQFQGGVMAAGYRPANAGPVYMDGGSPLSHGNGWNVIRPSYGGYHPQQLSQSRLGQQAGHYDQQQQQHHYHQQQQHQHQPPYPYQYASVRSSEQISIPFSAAHPHLGRQFLAPCSQGATGHSFPFILSGAPGPSQGIHIHNQMSPGGPVAHWASGFPNHRYGPFHQRFPSMSSRRDGRMDV